MATFFHSSIILFNRILMAWKRRRNNLCPTRQRVSFNGVRIAHSRRYSLSKHFSSKSIVWCKIFCQHHFFWSLVWGCISKKRLRVWCKIFCQHQFHQFFLELYMGLY
ncbi:uncharacterized protein LOC141639105 [Silene latifolia]|uniref:uncharacterized protein LOC141639105 n=1 Tax=Silene latifolia TaxID=37657 RepID=UPI003D78150A